MAPNRSSWLGALLFILALISNALGAPGPTDPSVTIASGVLVGTTSTVSTPTVATAAVTQYLGIPYASSPPKRFAPCEPPEKWSDPLRAQKRKPVCTQQFASLLNLFGRYPEIFNDPGSTPPEESEDCMYINVFIPPGTKPSDKKTVLFWVFGGNLAFGGGSLHVYDGSSFAYNQDVIVVTHNYRTNLFGFPGSPQIPLKEQNVGFLDQRMALQWVQDNIENFGGDPSKVTIFGQSAGGLSVRSLIGNPPSPLPFRAAIMESEASLTTNLAIPLSNTSIGSSWEELAIAAGCLIPSTQLECMRSKPASTLKSLSEIASIQFFPVEDKSTFTTDIRPALKSGSAANVPLIMGTNTDEGRFIPYQLGLEDNATSIISALNLLLPGNSEIANALTDIVTEEPLSQTLSEILTQVVFMCPGSQLASAVQAAGFKIWRYMYGAVFPNAEIFAHAGAYHSVEIFSVFGTYFLSNKFGDATPEQIETSKYMQTAWANFAKHPSKDPEENWPELGVDGKINYISNNGTYITTASATDPKICGALNALIGQAVI